MSTITTKGQKAKAVNARDFDIRDMIGYALGDVGNNFTFNLVNSFLMIFYTNVFGLAAALVGALFMAARLVDAFVDIMVGRLIDNSKMTKRGRFTPWVMRMKFPLAASAILLFLPAAGHLPMTTRGLRLRHLPGLGHLLLLCQYPLWIHGVSHLREAARQDLAIHRTEHWLGFRRRHR